MKITLASLFLVAAGLALSGCESDLPPEPRERPLVRGLTGHGTVVPIDKKNDPMINEASGSGY